MHTNERSTPLILVCGPWGSGTSAVAGMLARIGIFAPGPYFRVNDPRTPETVEMLAFRKALLSIASEQALMRTASTSLIMAALREFRDGPLAQARREGGIDEQQPVLLKHGLAALTLPELSSVFDLRIIGVLRPLEAIEATRRRRRWPLYLGSDGAKVIYSHMFNHLINATTPFHLVRFDELRTNPSSTLDSLAKFLEVDLQETHRARAFEFLNKGLEK